MTDWTLADEPDSPIPDFKQEIGGTILDYQGNPDDGIDRSASSPIVQMVEGEVLYRASSVGGCPRKLWAARSGYPAQPPTAKMQAIFDRGHELEPIILKALQDRGWQLRNYQGEVLFQVFTLPSGTTISIIGHYDCEARYPLLGQLANPSHEANWSEWYPCDVKGFGPDLISEYLSHGIDNLPHYQWQQSIYVIGHDSAKAFLMPIWDKEKNELLQSSLYPRIPDITLTDIESKLASIEHAYLNSQMPECTLEYPCPYYNLHDEKASPSDTVPPEAIIFIVARNNADAKIKLFQSAKDAMTEQLLKILPEGFSAEYEGSKISVTPNSGRFNTNHAKDILREAGFDIESEEFNSKGVGYKLVIIPPR
jgi:hypothetical protein